jgi:hypothetical protein
MRLPESQRVKCNVSVRAIAGVWPQPVGIPALQLALPIIDTDVGGVPGSALVWSLREAPGR